MTDEAAGPVFDVSSPAFATQQTSPSREWQPPSVEELQKALPQYEVTAFLARGGMGAVYKGLHRALKRAVAIKVLPPEIEDADLQFAARFKHEAQAMAQLTHPNIVAVYDAGETVGGLLYFVMEFIEGTDVHQLITSEKRLDPQRALGITAAVCDALAFAHEEGIIHRDIKPSNIMLDKKGRVKVADFGLAKAVNLDSTMLTGSNVAMGTPDFIAPEALIAGTLVDQRADIYAVGVMLYQMLTGRIPRGRFAMPSGIVPQIDPRLDAIVDKAMQTEREQRYSTAQEMKAEVERVFQLVPDPSVSTVGTSRKTRSTAKPLLFGLITGAIVLAAGAFFGLKKPAATEAATDETESAPAVGSAPIPRGQWTKVFTKMEDITPFARTHGVVIRDGWIDGSASSTMRPLLAVPGGHGKNHGIRLHGKYTPSTDAIPINCGIFLRREGEQSRYVLNLRDNGSVLGFIRKLRPAPAPETVIGSSKVEPALADGAEFDMQFIVIGDKLHGRFNGKDLPVVTDAELAQGEFGVQTRLLIRDVEAINLDGLSEAEALKAAGVEGK